MEKQEIDKALKEVFELLSETNIYIDKNAPWKLKKSNLDRMNTVLSISIELIKRSTLLLFPIMPDSCKKILDLINFDLNLINLDEYKKLPSKSFKIKDSSPIFPRI